MPAVIDDLQIKEKPKKKEPSPLSMRTGDMLAQMEGASPIAQSSMLRGLGDVERHRQQNEPRLAMLHRQRETEVMDQRDSQSDQPKLLGRIEWARLQYPELAKKKRITQRENKLVTDGYELYFKRHFLQQKSQQAGALSQARIGALQAQAGSSGRANQPGTMAEYIVSLMRAGRPIPPQAIAMYNAASTSRERIATEKVGSTEGIAQRALGANVDKWGAERKALVTSQQLGRDAMMDRSKSDRQGRMNIAMLKGGEEKKVVPTDRVVELGESASNIGTPMTANKKTFTPTFEEWMAEYMQIAPMTTPSQRATLKKALGRHLPSIDELQGMVVVPQGTQAQPAEMRSFLGVDRLRPDKAEILAAPPTPENIEQAHARLDMVIEGMRLHGISEKGLAEYRMIMTRLLGGQKSEPPRVNNG